MRITKILFRKESLKKFSYSLKIIVILGIRKVIRIRKLNNKAKMLKLNSILVKNIINTIKN